MSHEPTGSPDPAATKRTRLIVGAVVIALLVVGGVVWLVSRGGSDNAQTSSASGGSASPTPTPSLSTVPRPKAKKTKPIKPYTGKVNPQKPQQVSFRKTGRPGKGLVVTIAKVESVTAKAVTAGQVGGPALRITVAVHNQGRKAVPIYAALTNLYYGPKRTPADPALKPGAKPFPPSVGPGRTVTGVVLYTISKAHRSGLDLEVNLDNRLRTLEFAGSCPQDC